MGRIVVTENVTLDGVIEMVGDWFSPAGDAEEQADMLAATREHMAAEAANLLGRRTFEAFRGYWPARTDDTTGITAHLDCVPKYVVSRTLGEPGWANSTVLRGDPVDEARALRDRVEGDVGVTGSITLVHALVAAGVVDEYRLFTYPVVVGRGRRLFDGAGAGRLALAEVRRFRSGVVLSRYLPAGEPGGGAD